MNKLDKKINLITINEKYCNNINNIHLDENSILCIQNLKIKLPQEFKNFFVQKNKNDYIISNINDRQLLQEFKPMSICKNNILITTLKNNDENLYIINVNINERKNSLILYKKLLYLFDLINNLKFKGKIIVTGDFGVNEYNCENFYHFFTAMHNIGYHKINHGDSDTSHIFIPYEYKFEELGKNNNMIKTKIKINK